MLERFSLGIYMARGKAGDFWISGGNPGPNASRPLACVPSRERACIGAWGQATCEKEALYLVISGPPLSRVVEFSK